jgi:hypothetical protein
MIYIKYNYATSLWNLVELVDETEYVRGICNFKHDAMQMMLDYGHSIID